MELIFENVKNKKGGALTGASSTGAGHGGALTGASSTGAGKKLNARQLGGLVRQHSRIHGAGWFGDFVDGFKQGFTGVMNTALPLMDLVPGMSAVTAPLKVVNGVLGGKKPRRVRGGNAEAKKEGEKAFDELLVGNSKTGGKKPNARAEIVKKVMAKKGLSLSEASKYVKANNLYKKQK